MKRLWQRFSNREKGLVAAAVVVIFLILARTLVLDPYLERREWVKNQLEIEPQRLAKNLRFLGQKEELLKALDAARRDLKEREPKLLTGDTASVSASDLQDTVQALASKEGTQVISTRVLNPEIVGSFSKISIQMEIGGQIDQAANLIRSVESAPKLLLVDEINIRSLFRPVGLPQAPNLSQAAAQNLRMSLTVSGFARNQVANSSQSGLGSSPSTNRQGEDS